MLRSILVPRSITRLLVGLLAALLVATGLGSSPALAAASGTLSIDMVVNNSGVESHSSAVASGGKKLFVIKYSCSGSDCDNVQITLPVASTVTLSEAQYQSDLTMTQVGGIVTWAAASLPAGTTSQITFSMTVNAGQSANGAVISHQASIAGFGSPKTSSPAVDLTVRAGSTTSALLGVEAGGAIDAYTSYVASACLMQDPDPSFGLLGVNAGSKLTLKFPVGAVVREAKNAKVTGSPATGVTVVFGLGDVTSTGCIDKHVKVEYSSSDPANVVGTTKTVTLSWDGVKPGSAPAQLGQDTAATPLTPQSSTGSTAQIGASISDDKPQPGDAVTINYSASNGAREVWDKLVVDSQLATSLTPTLITATTSRSAGVLYVSIDGGPLVKAADIPAKAVLQFDPYTSLLSPGQTVTAVRFETGGNQPGDGGMPLQILATVRSTTTDGKPVNNGDAFTVPATTSVDGSAGGHQDVPVPVSFTITQAQPVILTRMSPDGTYPNGSTVTFALTGSVTKKPIVDPVFVARFPEFVSFSSAHVDAAAGLPLPDPTATVLPDTTGAGRTLVRFTWPAGTTIPAGKGVTLNMRATLAAKAYGDQKVFGAVVPKTGGYDCAEYYFTEKDVEDLDGNGSTTNNLCAWGNVISPAPAVGAQVVQSVKGSWDSAYAAGPATSYSSPGSADSLRTQLVNTGNLFLDGAVVITRLPRAGDQAMLSSAGRSPASSTFPVVLSGAPVTPTLAKPVDTYWTDEADPCTPELGYSASGCTTPTWKLWSASAPTDLTKVTAVKFDFGLNQLKPYSTWPVDLPVTTPTSGATEQDYAVANPSPTNAANDERAVATSAAAVRRADIKSALNPIESTPVTLQMPGSSGPYAPPTAVDLTTTGPAGTPQHTTVTIPKNGSVELTSGGVAVPGNQVVVTGEGTYVLDPSTGVITFTPETGFIGKGTGVTYRVKDAFGADASATYKPKVTPPAAPNPADATTTDTQGKKQSTTFTVPTGGSVKLVDPTTLTPITSNTVTVSGVGEYVVDPSTGKVTFTPEKGYVGTPSGVTVAVTDVYGQGGYATYVPTVTPAPAPTPANLTTTGVGTTVQQTTPTVDPGDQVSLVVGGVVVPGNSVTIPNQGTYVLDPGTGKITFTPVPGYAGTATSVTYRVTTPYATTGDATYTPTVTPPAPPAPPSVTSTGPQDTVQKVSVTVPSGTTLKLWDGTQEVTSVTVPGQGVYTIKGTDLVFTPEKGFVGTPTPISYQLTDLYGQIGRATYEPAVTANVVVAGVQPTTERGQKGQPVTLNPIDKFTPPSGETAVPSSLRISVPGNPAGVTTLTTPQGTWTVQPNGSVVFSPVAGFVGIATVPFQVSASGGSAYRSTMSVVVTGSISGSRTATVYFKVYSAKINARGQAALRQVVEGIPAAATTVGISIGYVQPDDTTSNDHSLSKRRATRIAGFVAKLRAMDQVSISAKGRAKQRGAKARRATITVTWTLTQS